MIGQEYTITDEFLKDIDLIFWNCRTYNGAESPIGQICDEAEEETRRIFNYLYDENNVSIHLSVPEARKSKRAQLIESISKKKTSTDPKPSEKKKDKKEKKEKKKPTKEKTEGANPEEKKLKKKRKEQDESSDDYEEGRKDKKQKKEKDNQPPPKDVPKETLKIKINPKNVVQPKEKPVPAATSSEQPKKVRFVR